jgi:magnesium chelatase family protein
MNRALALDKTHHSAGEQILKQAISRLRLSARGYHRVLKIARTSADLAGAQRVNAAHIAEAVQYRRLAAG